MSLTSDSIRSSVDLLLHSNDSNGLLELVDRVFDHSVIVSSNDHNFELIKVLLYKLMEPFSMGQGQNHSELTVTLRPVLTKISRKLMEQTDPARNAEVKEIC